MLSTGNKVQIVDIISKYLIEKLENINYRNIFRRYSCSDRKWCCIQENRSKKCAREADIKVSSIGPATMLKNELFQSFFFKLFDYDCRRTFEKHFSVVVFRNIFTRKTFYCKIQVKYQLPHFL